MLIHATAWMDLEDVVLGEIGQSHTHTKRTHKYCMNPLKLPRVAEFIKAERKAILRVWNRVEGGYYLTGTEIQIWKMKFWR